MGIDGSTRHWDVTQPASTSLKRLASETPEQAFTRWRETMRRAGVPESQIAPIWEANRQRVRDLQAYLATQGIKLDLAGEGL